MKCIASRLNLRWRVGRASDANVELRQMFFLVGIFSVSIRSTNAQNLRAARKFSSAFLMRL